MPLDLQQMLLIWGITFFGGFLLGRFVRSYRDR